jgi:hypothetical protein
MRPLFPPILLTRPANLIARLGLISLSITRPSVRRTLAKHPGNLPNLRSLRSIFSSSQTVINLTARTPVCEPDWIADLRARVHCSVGDYSLYFRCQIIEIQTQQVSPWRNSAPSKSISPQWPELEYEEGTASTGETVTLVLETLL